MKKYITLGGLALAAMLGTTSCGDDFLTVQSSNQLFVDEYYNSEARIFEALVAAYDPLNWLDYAWAYTNLSMTSDIMSDDVYVGGSGPTDQGGLHKQSIFEATPTQQVASGLWSALYSGINRSNIVQQYMGGATDISDANRKLYLAEAKTLRTFYYVWLWKFWGNVPYYTENLTYPYLHEQNTADQVYDGIITSLEEVITDNILPMRREGTEIGRVTQAFVYMMYADCVMYQKDETRYTKALGYMKEIISSGKYSLTPNYADIWEESTGEWNQESIFEIEYFNKNGGRDWGSAIADGGTVYPKLIGINNLNGSPDYAGGWGFEPVRQEAYDMFDESDKRRDASILNFAHYKIENPDASYVGRYQDTGNFLRKYLPRVGGNEGASGAADMNYNNNCRLYRYAETLLNAAELSLLTSGDAQGYLDQVRTRAGVPSISATIDNILQERHLEFVGEGKRYWDLVRSGKAATVLAPGSTPYRQKGWNETKKWLPIPQGEIDSAGGTLVQNPYAD
ncbi:RagB/SusD family nutrient uptake outer membrane protein [Bacteroides helcogenes]|uniref:RagB/SusD domain protein n=1 Tax=Bacteroides helcogenes (strain ATCC 35417 / DSM 20613 / JCM 6297 / CCUG 15421 / P 36-108) TaxID=693979 RepID=E6SMZ6_BACT6|nr:RagB/SusD family nutrient uptake outer membrane protein [Bacteroides helcogenes]ADV43665.1 RagB/SusD domain protein [Bacteroides helcogenes P 36-108]MDY5239387.1 RagB/SusD family nutrient uptake outer membrane protein [Bacteroides helcogenes]